MKRIPRDLALRFEFDARVPPILRVAPGESFVVETEDAIAGQIRDEGTLPIPERLWSFKTTPPRANPMGGPVYLEGAEKGDLVVVNIEKVEVDDQGVTAIFPIAGPLHDSIKWKVLSEPYTKIIRHLPGPSGTTRDGKGVFNDKITWDLKPFIGCLGVCPEVEVETAAVGQGPWGGNLDVRDFCEGSKVFLNCYHAGGLFYVGDVHASQGDTEFYGVADETRATLQLSLGLVKRKRCGFVRIEKRDSIIAVWSAKPCEEAIRNAIFDLMDWMVTDYGVPPREAYMHACINPDFRVHVYQMVPLGRLQYTCGAEVPKKYLVGP